jgi:twitching motility protein PilT
MSHGSNGNQAVVVVAPVPSVDDLINRMSSDYKELEVNKFFRALVKLEGSDLHLKVGKPPCVACGTSSSR